MKKGDIIDIRIEGIEFPGKSWGMVEEESNAKKVVVKNGIPAVSYTHLDVYKRQPLGCLVPWRTM